MRASLLAILSIWAGAFAFGPASIASAEDTEAAPTDVDEDDREDDAAVEEEDDEEFCGGDSDPGDLVLWQAEEALVAGDPTGAVRGVIAGLQRGTIRGGRRARAWQLVGEARLRMGQARRAEHAYLRSFAFETPRDDDPARVGLAMARGARGMRTLARQGAAAFVAAACEADAPEQRAACYGARILLAELAQAEQDETASAEQLERAESLRTAGSDSGFASMDELVARLDAR